MSHLFSYLRCGSCSAQSKQIRPAGSIDAKIMLIGDTVGIWEDKANEPFKGRAGDELTRTYLRLADLRRSEVFLTTVVQCRQLRNGQDQRPGAALISSCADNHLQEEIWSVNPEMIVLCGSVACSLVPDITLEYDHGFPRRVEDCPGLFGWSGTVVPMYHPAAGMTESRFMIWLLEDWERLGKYRRGAWEPPITSPLALKPDYRLLTTEDEVWSAFDTHGRGEFYKHLPVDTESDEGRIWSIQFSTAPGNGYMILAENKPLIDTFDTNLSWNYDRKIVAHNAPYDLDELDEAGVHVKECRDTMQELYHLGNLPQGLKPATYRTSGHRMVSYDETVTPWSKAKLNNWLAEAIDYAGSIRERDYHPVGKGCPTCGKNHRKDVSKEIPHEAEAVLRRVMKYTGETSEYDPWLAPKWSRGEETTRLFGRTWFDEFELACGRMPRRSIVHVPLHLARDYGCSDADHTGRLALWLDKERSRITQEEWNV